MKKNLLIAELMTIVTTVLFGLIYPLIITGLAQLFMKDKANGQLINAFGATNLIMANINVYDPKIQALIASLKIPSNALPLFITTQTYLSSSNGTSGCCIGGYHSVSSSGQPYSSATYITTSGAFCTAARLSPS